MKHVFAYTMKSCDIVDKLFIMQIIYSMLIFRVKNKRMCSSVDAMLKHFLKLKLLLKFSG